MYIGTLNAYLMNDVTAEFVKQYVIQILNVIQIRYVKIVYVLVVVTAILHALIMKHVLTNNVEVRDNCMFTKLITKNIKFYRSL